jgi:hypothetical protein
MTEHGAEEIEPRYFGTSPELKDYLSKRLQISKQMDRIDAAGEEIPREIYASNKSLSTKKVRILNGIIFQAMADLTFFFETIALHPKLQEIFDLDIKDLLGVRHDSSQEYGFMILKLLRSILMVEDVQKDYKRDDFRLSLNYKILGIVMDKAKPFLPFVFNNVHAEHAVWDDLGKAWAWTRMLAINKEFREPHRTFDLGNSKLLKHS